MKYKLLVLSILLISCIKEFDNDTDIAGIVVHSGTKKPLEGVKVFVYGFNHSHKPLCFSCPVEDYIEKTTYTDNN